MSDVMEEINDELRQQKLEAFWKENRSWIIASIILAIMTTAGITWWRNWNFKQNLSSTTELLRVEKEGSKALTEFAKDARKNHAVFARLLAAGQYARDGQTDKAVTLYNEIGEQRGLDRPLRDLAKVLSISERLSTDDPKKLHGELADLSGKNAPYRYSALEMNALVYAREGKLKEASEQLQTILTSADAPADARMRATTLREFYGATAGISPSAKDAKGGK